MNNDPNLINNIVQSMILLRVNQNTQNFILGNIAMNDYNLIQLQILNVLFTNDLGEISSFFTYLFNENILNQGNYYLIFDEHFRNLLGFIRIHIFPNSRKSNSNDENVNTIIRNMIINFDFNYLRYYLTHL